jgi:hypothetical protein
LTFIVDNSGKINWVIVRQKAQEIGALHVALDRESIMLALFLPGSPSDSTRLDGMGSRQGILLGTEKVNRTLSSSRQRSYWSAK